MRGLNPLIFIVVVMVIVVVIVYGPFAGRVWLDA